MSILADRRLILIEQVESECGIRQIASRVEVTILVSCLHICPFQTLPNFKKACNFNILDLASELPLVPQEEMTLMNKNLFVKLTDDIEVSGQLTAEDKELLKSLETMAEEIDGEADPPS
jgi:hypothetical protein